jgi:hypothetical protein
MKEFQLIDGPQVPPAIKPMTELHDKLVKGYNEDKELKLPKLIQSMENRLSRQVEELVSLENMIQTSNGKLAAVLAVFREIMNADHTSDETKEMIVDRLQEVSV